MKIRQGIVGIVLLLLIAAAVMVFFRTEQQRGPSGLQTTGPLAQNANPRAQVDQSPLQTARRVGTLAFTQEEKELARQAEKVADHEVDLAFFDAFRASQENPAPLTPALKHLADRKNQTQQAVKQDQDNVSELTRKIAAAPESQKEILNDHLDVAQAQLELDQDELDDAAAALLQAGGDPQAEVQHQKQEHDDEEAHMSSYPGSAANHAEDDYQGHTLLLVFRAWKALRDKKATIEEARQQAAADQRSLQQQHSTGSAEAQQESQSRESAKQQAQGFTRNHKSSSRNESKAAAEAALDSLKHYRQNQKNLADLGRRMQDQKQLGDIYGNWIGLVETRERAALHNLITTLLWILLVALIVYLANRLIEHLFTGMTAENKRIDTLRSVVKFAAQSVGAIIIAFLVLGMPAQTTTVLGLAGAGLTVAMKDFIVAFFGWFVLMGKNGIRVGDWVEINGVGGEVVEIGLLKTVLLETGNWTDSGHPTGRRVSFVNSFAMENHFFNFSTSGQWMWDELQLTVPGGQDPYAVIDELQKLVAQETEKNARLAEQEWGQAAHRYHLQSFSATPAITVRPTGSAVEVRVRYITRAYERHETRKRLYDAVIKLMHKPSQGTA